MSCDLTAPAGRRHGRWTAVAVLLAALCAPAVFAQGFLADRLPADLNGTWEIFLGATPTAGGWQPVAVPGPWEDGPPPGFDGHACHRTRIWLPGQETGLLGLRFDRIREAVSLVDCREPSSTRRVAVVRWRVVRRDVVSSAA